MGVQSIQERETWRGVMAADDATAGYSEARWMLDIYASVSADAVDLTITDSTGDKEQFRRNVSLAELARMLPALLDDAGRRRRNVIVRPHGPGITFLQLDDLDAEKLARLRPAMYLALKTSPGNHQAWLAIPAKTLPAGCAKAPEPIRVPAVQRAFPAA
jgi:DNA primase RepB-like protein